ncbi:Vesicle transport v-SNARE protein vti1 [Smittium culicis]|uniref:Vesicle transport v-SNARE protein vti1 n=1 Tax=Smittium culicis TaxID=133412 RepID=A0A1R1X0W1_9FUNG|nr:Vesicle transport v-SNARE protein vti1 [Smittium culicis]
MELELLNVSGAEKSLAGPKVKKYKSQLNVLKRKMQEQKSGLSNMAGDRAELFGSSNMAIGNFNNDEIGSYDQRARLLQGTAALEQSSRKLQDSHRIAIETGLFQL